MAIFAAGQFSVKKTFSLSTEAMQKIAAQSFQRGKRFQNKEEVNAAFKDGLRRVTESGNKDGIDGLLRRWEKCLEVESSCVE